MLCYSAKAVVRRQGLLNSKKTKTPVTLPIDSDVLE